ARREALQGGGDRRQVFRFFSGQVSGRREQQAVPRQDHGALEVLDAPREVPLPCALVTNHYNSSSSGAHPWCRASRGSPVSSGSSSARLLCQLRCRDAASLRASSGAGASVGAAPPPGPAGRSCSAGCACLSGRTRRGRPWNVVPGCPAADSSSSPSRGSGSAGDAATPTSDSAFVARSLAAPPPPSASAPGSTSSSGSSTIALVPRYGDGVSDTSTPCLRASR